MRLLRAADRLAAPWKNGGGVTRQIAAFPEGVDLEGFGWRISIAQVTAGGPFSRFPGVDRDLTVLEGRLRLFVAARPALDLSPLDMHGARFDGDADTRAELPDGPVTDLNVMTRRGAFASTVRALTAPEADNVRLRTDLAVLVAAGTTRVALDGASERLERFDAVLIEGAAGLALAVEASSAPRLIEIEARAEDGPA